MAFGFGGLVGRDRSSLSAGRRLPLWFYAGDVSVSWINAAALVGHGRTELYNGLDCRHTVDDVPIAGNRRLGGSSNTMMFRFASLIGPHLRIRDAAILRSDHFSTLCRR